jgi:hypothetical protein
MGFSPTSTVKRRGVGDGSTEGIVTASSLPPQAARAMTDRINISFLISLTIRI